MTSIQIEIYLSVEDRTFKDDVFPDDLLVRLEAVAATAGHVNAITAAVLLSAMDDTDGHGHPRKALTKVR